MNDKIEALKQLRQAISDLCREFTERHGGSVGLKKDHGYINPRTGKEAWNEKTDGVRVSAEFNGVTIEV